MSHRLDFATSANKKYEATWEDLDARPLPEWYDRAKIGIFVHWGVYSVPGFYSEWFWYVWMGLLSSQITFSDQGIKDFLENNYRPGFTYQEFAPMFAAEFFDPNYWANMFQYSGAKYVILTSKHHDGYTLFPSNQTYSWNSVDIGPHRDIVAELGEAVRKRGMEYGLYYSLLEWFNPMYMQDLLSASPSYVYVDKKMLPELKSLVTMYKPSVLWVDGEWECEADYWKSKEILAWLYNESPVKDHVVVNDRWGARLRCVHGDFYNCDDRFNPGSLQEHKWENAFSLDINSWGYRRNMDLSHVLTSKELIMTVIKTVSCGGNALINVGPTKEGIIPLIFQERLKDLGDWLRINGEAIYDTSPWLYQNDTFLGDVWYTCTKMGFNARKPTAVPSVLDKITAIYAIFGCWPVNNILNLRQITSQIQNRPYQVEMLGEYGKLNWKIIDGEFTVRLPNKAAVSTTHAWTLKFTPSELVNDTDTSVNDVNDKLNF
ncbi:tissue alpha-L-fucosidase-like [Pectinophora gossypiella]|uniref:tissue alpha-L-fucosidase-like n=1 Tax=Pectinophora gossypiella TaxID=13191 RepID=UPI00214EE4E3|nr:tissue alpha-L-fucosidase-like [Pectinophora gossypiella]